MTAHELAGHVVVVAGDGAALARVAAGLARGGGEVAVVASERRSPDAALEFRTQPRDIEGLRRIAAHVEQRLGPIDVVVTDPATAAVATEVFAGDLRRRGRGEVVVVGDDDDVDDVVSRLGGRP
jgi:hypothetical protein